MSYHTAEYPRVGHDFDRLESPYPPVEHFLKLFKSEHPSNFMAKGFFFNKWGVFQTKDSQEKDPGKAQGFQVATK